VSSDQYRVGIIGLGRIGAVHVEAWESLGNAHVVAACDSSETARAAASSKGMDVFSNPAEMLDSMKLDAVSICAPPNQHQPLAEICFEKGVPVLCEKPLAADGESATTLVASAHRHGARFQLATKFRHVPELQMARRLMADGAVGDPLTFRIEFAGPVDMSQRWNSDPAFSGGGVLIDNGSHALDLSRFLFSPIDSVMAVNLKPIQKLQVEDSALLLVSTECGVTGKIMLSWSMKPADQDYVVVQGSKGQIAIGWKESWLRVDGQAPQKIGSGYDKNDSHKRMMTMFREFAQGRGPGWISEEEALSSALVTDAAYQSIRAQRWVKVEAPKLAGLKRPAAADSGLRLVAGAR
jgi:predicted dehydrogenase